MVVELEPERAGEVRGRRHGVLAEVQPRDVAARAAAAVRGPARQGENRAGRPQIWRRVGPNHGSSPVL